MPTLTLFAGINGAGKSTLYNETSNNEYAEDLGTRINLDEEVVEMGGDWRNFRDTIDASKVVLDKMQYCLDNKISFNWEVTVISPFVLKILRDAKERGFTINLNFIGVHDINLSLKRISERVKNGGHGIDEKTLRLRHQLQFKNLKTALKLVNYALFYDNSKDSLSVVATYFDKTLHVYKPETYWLDDLLDENTIRTNTSIDN